MDDINNQPRASREQFTDAMRHVASCVSVVTTDGEAGRFGATVSAFCSVSADPPMVLVCLHRDSRIAKAVTANKSFNVNVLPQSGHFLAERFSGRHDADIGDRFDGIGFSNDFAPAFNDSVVFSCRVNNAVEAGSHWVVIADVEALDGVASDPLIYADWAFRSLSPNSKVGE